MTSGRTYCIEVFGSVASAAGTVGIQFKWQESGGATSSSCSGQIIYGLTATSSSDYYIYAANVWTAAGSGPGVNANSPLMMRFFYNCTASGTLTLWMRSEVNTSTVTMYSGSTGRAIVVP